MADDWDADDFDPEAGFAKDEDDQWQGEDEELLKVLNKEEEEENKEVPTASADKPKKSKSERIEEKKAERRAKEQKAKEESEDSNRPLTAQEVYEDKMRSLKLQKDADLELAKELLGASGSATPSGIDAMMPSSQEDFVKFEEALSKKILQFQSSSHFVSFMESLIRSTCAGFEVEDLRHLSNTLSTIAQEKQKMAKAAKAKKKGTKSLNTGKGVRKQLGGALGDEFDDYSISDAGGKQLMDEDYDFM